MYLQTGQRTKADCGIVLIAILAVVWYPFFKIYDSQLGTKEKMKEEGYGEYLPLIK